MNPSQPEKKCACPDKDCPCWSLPSHSQDKEPSPSQEEWEMEFDARFTHEERGFAGEIISREVNAEHLGDVKSKLFPEIKNFIALTISQARASTLKEVGEVLVGLEKTVFLPLPENAKEFMGDFERGTVGGANYAIRTVIEVLQEKGDKSNTKNI